MTRDGLAKQLVLAAVMVVVGLVIGGIGPRSEVRSLRARLDELEHRPCQNTTGRDLAGLFRGRPWDGGAAPEAAPDEPTDAPPDAPVVVVPTDPDGARPGDAPPGEAAGPSPDELDAIRDAMELRRTQALAALREQAGASDEQMAQVDEVVQGMNDDLRALAEEFVATTREGEPSRRDLMTFASDTLDVLIGTEDALYGALPEDQREGLTDEALDPTAYVDGSIVDLFAELDR
ncbi:MAG: hypothetical protein ABMB14_01150 [Myxococcota bacterium]